MINNLEKFIEFYLNKKSKFNESIDLNVVFFNKKKNFFNLNLNLIHSVNEKKNFLFLSNINKIEKNIFFGKLYFDKFLKKEICFDKIFFNKENYYLIKQNNLLKKFCEKKFLIENYNKEIFKINSNLLKIIVNKNNFLNLKIGNILFNKNMIKNNYYCVINSIKKIFNYNNIIIKKIYLNTTMSKSFLIK
ncbi:hypothetical protein [Candidatus Carsonella ruddii]|uniref:hypothetical protein n=1 Tax=Carsonella ruddii TaxID=114186 RepID=UPI00247B1B7A|nr:hypothetical protein [Candidatus Carsonella ruddii]WGS66653.1 hypothetical protein MEJ66_01050 [Candidatus Carsonella ruddii]